MIMDKELNAPRTSAYLYHDPFHGELDVGQLKHRKLDVELTHPGGGSFSFLPRSPVMIGLLLLLYRAMFGIVPSFRSSSNHAAPAVELLLESPPAV